MHTATTASRTVIEAPVAVPVATTASPPGVTGRVLLHLADPPPAVRRLVERCLPALLQRMAAARRDVAATPAHLKVLDRQGRSLHETDANRALVELCLPPGTYHLHLLQGARHRCFTLALAAGQAVHLHVTAWRPN
jgi:hypothetical protein